MKSIFADAADFSKPFLNDERSDILKGLSVGRGPLTQRLCLSAGLPLCYLNDQLAKKVPVPE